MTQTASLEITQEKEMTVVIRPEFKNICQKDACRAAIFNHILYWIAYKRKQGEACWYATGQQIYKQLCETWGISVIRRSINALIATGMIGETHNPKWGADRTKYFFFGQDQAKSFFTACTQEKICPWCISHLPPIVSDLLTTHLLILSNANDESVKCICQNHQMELLKTANGSDRSNKAITKGSTKGTSKILSREAIEESEDSLVASANAESDGGASFLSRVRSFEDTLKEVQNGQAPLYTSCIPPGHEGEPVKPAGDSEEPAVTSAVHDTTPLQEIPTEPLFPAAQPPPGNKTDKKGDSKVSGKKDTRSPEERTRCQKWQAFFNARRGGEPLALKGPRINESECIISLVQKFTDEQITAIDSFVLAEIFPHKLPANKHKVGARIILDESQNAREVLKDRFKWPMPGTSSGSISSSQSGPKPDKYILHMRKLTQVSHASQAILEGREMPPLVGEYFTAQDHEDYRQRVLEMVEDGRACYEKEKVAL